MELIRERERERDRVRERVGRLVEKKRYIERERGVELKDDKARTGTDEERE